MRKKQHVSSLLTEAHTPDGYCPGCDIADSNTSYDLGQRDSMSGGSQPVLTMAAEEWQMHKLQQQQLEEVEEKDKEIISGMPLPPELGNPTEGPARTPGANKRRATPEEPTTGGTFIIRCCKALVLKHFSTGSTF